ncbi:MAG: hypothetical protein MJ151_04715 [Lachnospiraceae bacterium]|nr:hypothetical protein [Lachnospiraceae bacterium]
MFVKRMMGVMFFVVMVSFVVAVASTIIFLFDMNGSKGLMPLIFFCLMLYFLLSFSMRMMKNSFNNNRRKVSIKNSNLLLGIISGIIFFLSLYVFWM